MSFEKLIFFVLQLSSKWIFNLLRHFKTFLLIHYENSTKAIVSYVSIRWISPVIGTIVLILMTDWLDVAALIQKWLFPEI